MLYSDIEIRVTHGQRGHTILLRRAPSGPWHIFMRHPSAHIIHVAAEALRAETLAYGWQFRHIDQMPVAEPAHQPQPARTQPA